MQKTAANDPGTLITLTTNAPWSAPISRVTPLLPDTLQKRFRLGAHRLFFFRFEFIGDIRHLPRILPPR